MNTINLGNEKRNLKFFLGGDDAEKTRIIEVLTEASVGYVDAGLKWGAKTSDYGSEVFVKAEQDGFVPVLVELELDCDMPETAVVVDHHGELSGNPPAILQVLELLGIKPIRWDLVVAANDAGWYPGLQGKAEIPGMGRLNPPATEAEMKKVRFSGYSDEVVSEANRALAVPQETVGNIRIIRMSHSTTGPIGDAFAIPAIFSGVEIPQYVVFSENGETNFSGDGALCAELAEEFPEAPAPWNTEKMEKCFSGGAGLGKVGETAFWGGYSSQTKVLKFLTQKFS
jgi:hypothetical protein